MVSELDIWRTANIVKHHGSDAVFFAAQQMDAMLAKGDLEGQVVWRRMLRAVEELQRLARGVDEVLN